LRENQLIKTESSQIYSIKQGSESQKKNSVAGTTV